MIGKTEGLYLDQRNDPNWNGDYHPDFDAGQFYGTVIRAMYTLFETTLEPLNIRPIVEKQPQMFPFFLCVIFLTTFGVMNVITGVIVENTMQVSKESSNDAQVALDLEKIKQVEKVRDA